MAHEGRLPAATALSKPAVPKKKQLLLLLLLFPTCALLHYELRCDLM
jgi:hypothetical protein